MNRSTTQGICTKTSFAWYKDAQQRAQMMLTLDGAFLSIIAGVIIVKGPDAVAATEVFGVETWIFLAVAGSGLFVSILCAVVCTLPKPQRHSKVCALMEYEGVRRRDGATCHPRLMWYFQHIHQLEDLPFVEKTGSVDADFERRALAYQVRALSGRVERKFWLLSMGFVGTGIALMSLLAFATSYLIRL